MVVPKQASVTHFRFERKLAQVLGKELVLARRMQPQRWLSSTSRTYCTASTGFCRMSGSACLADVRPKDMYQFREDSETIRVSWARLRGPSVSLWYRKR